MTDMPKYTAPDFDALVKEQAVLEQDAIERDKVDQFMRDRFFNEYVKSYDDKMAARKATIIENRAIIKYAAERHFLRTGDKPSHKAITISVSSPHKYNKDEALKWALKQGGLRKDKYVRVKKELNVREFNADLKDGTITWSGAETVKKVTVSVDSKLGEYAIIAELEAQAAAQKPAPKPEPVMPPASAARNTPDQPKIKRSDYVRNKEGSVGLVKRIEGYFVIVNILTKESKFLLAECTITDGAEYQRVNKSDGKKPETAA